MKNTTITFRIKDTDKHALQEKAKKEKQTLTKLIENKLKNE